jgi:hypothetical protein
MRSKEFINEINMSPTRLEQSAALTNAVAGMEFEMCVPGFELGDGDLKNDYDYDEAPRSLDHVREFFKRGENSNNTIQEVIDKLNEEFLEWSADQIAERWENDRHEYIREKITENGYIEEVNINDEEAVNELIDSVEEAEPDMYYHIMGQYFEEQQDLMSQTEFFEENYPNQMQQIYEENSDMLEWPYVVETSDPFEINPKTLDDLGETFSDMIGKEVNVGYRYHGAKRVPGEYCLEPDSSVMSEEAGVDGLIGLEFISPAMPLDEMLYDLDRVVNWAKNYGCETNETTGLHINMSIPSRTQSDLDYGKLALLLGDDYILEEYDRWGNEYCKPVLDDIRKSIIKNPEKALQALEKLRYSSNKFANKLIHNGFTEKRVSINVKNGGTYIEVRSPGGDWLNAGVDKLRNTLNRIAVAVDAAYDPNKYRNEYLKKLYKVLTPTRENDIIDLFVKYSTGNITVEQLKNKWGEIAVSSSNLDKQNLANKLTSVDWYIVKNPPNNFSMLVKARNENEAIETAKKEWVEHFDFSSKNTPTVQKVGPCAPVPKDNKTKFWKIVSGNEYNMRSGVPGKTELEAMKTLFREAPASFETGFSSIELVKR